MRRIWQSVILAGALGAAGVLSAQEARTGLDLRATLTAEGVASNELTEAPRSGAPMIAASRSVLYPTIKFSENWFLSGALQVTTRPYYYEDLSTTGYGAKGAVLQSTLNYARISQKGSLLVRAGQMSTAFGAFPLRYDDAENALVDLPAAYGYYYAPVTILGIAGVQVDATRGKWDGRAQLANSSPANPRSIFSKDQYANWAGGGGYTIRQGLRVGVSSYRGPYLDRKYPYFFPGEANPNKLPASAVGIDGSWTRGHSSIQGEWQKFVMPYTVIPTYRETGGYAEMRQVLSPRWFVAGRYGMTQANATGRSQVIEAAAGFRPNRLQLLKASYEARLYSFGSEQPDHIVGFQFVTTLHKGWGRE